MQAVRGLDRDLVAARGVSRNASAQPLLPAPRMAMFIVFPPSCGRSAARLVVARPPVNVSSPKRTPRGVRYRSTRTKSKGLLSRSATAKALVQPRRFRQGEALGRRLRVAVDAQELKIAVEEINFGQPSSRPAQSITPSCMAVKAVEFIVLRQRAVRRADVSPRAAFFPRGGTGARSNTPRTARVPRRAAAARRRVCRAPVCPCR